jgi:L-amino acid N-acyltransferase YncA
MLEDYPREIVIKDGTPVLIRPVDAEDEEALKNFINRIPPEERWFLRDNIDDPEIMAEWIKKLDPNRMVSLAAFRQDDGTILANVRLYRRTAKCMRHIAHLRIMVDPAYRHQRLGTWLLLDTVRLSMELEVEKLVAEFVAGVEDQARLGIQKLDFYEHAVLKDYVRDATGTYHDLVIMIKNIHTDWSDF